MYLLTMNMLVDHCDPLWGAQEQRISSSATDGQCAQCPGPVKPSACSFLLKAALGGGVVVIPARRVGKQQRVRLRNMAKGARVES